MADVITLLTLPKTSQGFSALRPTVVEAADDGRRSPPRKTPRLYADFASASSASRSHRMNQISPSKVGPLRMQITGEFPQRPLAKIDNSQQRSSLNFSIRTILTKDGNETLPATYDAIYSACRSVVCVFNDGEALYDNLTQQVERCMSVLSVDLTQGGTGMQWIKRFVETCQWFETQVSLLESVLTYLDQIYVLPTKLPKIRELCLSRFKNRLLHHSQIADSLRFGVSEWLEWERKFRGAKFSNRIRNDPADLPIVRLNHKMRDYIIKLSSHLIKHGQYGYVLESLYLESTESYYVDESSRLAQSQKEDQSSFIKQAGILIEDEVQRAKDILPASSWASVREVTVKALLGDRLEWLAGAIGSLIDAKSIPRLSKMYKLFADVDGLKILCAAFKAHIQTTVKAIVADSVLDEAMIPQLLDFNAFLDSAITRAFVDPLADTESRSTNSSDSITDGGGRPLGSSSPSKTNQDFIYARNDSFQIGFKARRNKPAELIAKYLDKLMRKGQKDAKDSDFESLLNSALALYKFTEDKDVFRTFYHRALAKRLLLQRSASDDFEKAMVKKLKEEYDPEFGMGDQMFTDLALSRDGMEEYHAKFSTDSLAQRLSVMVLQRSVWPFGALRKGMDLPPAMQAELTQYTRFYKTKHQGRKLYWDHQLGTATLRAQFEAGPKDLTVSLYQAVVLLLFNDADEITFKDISEQTRMVHSADVENDERWLPDDNELRRTLQSLACGKKKVLRKHPEGKEVGDEDVFRFNADFTDTRAKVHINSIQVKETPGESASMQAEIDCDRRHYLDAAIVRIMKAKRELSLERLKTATIDAVKLHFKASVDSIKQQIESLVEREYLKRDPNDHAMFIYVA